MPSPIGHALAGGAIALGREVWVALRGRSTPSRPWHRAVVGDGRVWLCAALAAAPDLDLLVGGHRTATHSLTAVAAVALAFGILGAARARPSAAGLALLCGCAWGSHLVLDWLAVDNSPPRGIELLWPFSHAWFISGLDLFAGTERRRIWTSASMLANGRAVAREVALLGPLAVGLWLGRERLAPHSTSGRRWAFGRWRVGRGRAFGAGTDVQPAHGMAAEQGRETRQNHGA